MYFYTANMKDNFSTQSDQYAQFRPTYPAGLFNYLLTLVPCTARAWDCGTGNGQVAQQLAVYFDHVDATDISRQQIEHAIIRPNITYSVQPAEKTTFPDNSFDLVTVAQAIHWFDFPPFYQEVNRTLKNSGILAVIGYGQLHITPGIDSIIADFYRNVIGPYWDKERRYVDEGYQTIPFPYPDINAPAFSIDFEWTFIHLIGYLETWSAVKHFQKTNHQNPVTLIYQQLYKAWDSVETRPGQFPILLRIARILK
jgi:SAM-dependent methyltransferase